MHAFVFRSEERRVGKECIFLEENNSPELLLDSFVIEATTASIRGEAAIIRMSSSSGFKAGTSCVQTEQRI